MLYLRNGEVVQASSNSVGGCSARVLQGRSAGFAASANVDGPTLAATLHAAADNLICLQRRWSGVGDASPAVEPGGGYHDLGTTKSSFTSKDRLDRLGALHAALRARLSGQGDLICGLEEAQAERSLMTSNGTAYYCYSPRTSLFVKLDIERNGSFGHAFETLTLMGDPEDQLDLLIEQAIGGFDALFDHADRYREAIYPDVGIHDVVLTPGLTGLLAHEAVGHMCEADHIFMGSKAAHSLDCQVASELVTLVDQGGRGSDGLATTACYVDDEGVPARDITLIEAGTLKGFLHSKATAHAMELPPTGNARAGAFDGEPLIRMRNTAIMAGGSSPSSMIEAIDHGYLLDRPGHGQADISGQFTFSVVRGYEIRYGRVGRAIKNISVSGSGFDALRSVTHVGSDFEWMPSGWCNKGQHIAVSMGGPSIKTRLAVGGR